MKIQTYILALLATCQLSAASYTVHSTDELDSLIDQKTIQAGDEIIWANGQYDQVQIDLTGIDGKPGAPITLRAETPGKVVLTGASQINIGADYAVVSGFHLKTVCDAAAPDKVIAFRGVNGDHANHTRLTNVVIEEAKNGQPVLDRSKWVVLYGQFNRVDHCYFADKRTHDNLMTVYLDESPERKPAYHQIDHNFFGPRQNGKLAGGTNNGWEIIRVGDSRTSLQPSLCRIERNYFERCNGEIEIISNKSGGNIYTGNAFVDCAGQLTLRHGFGCLVVDNLFLGGANADNEQSGVRIIGPDHQIIANTFWRLNGEGVRGAIVLTEGVRNGELNEYSPVANTQIRANIIADCRAPLVVGAMHGRKAKNGKINDVAPTDVTIDQNIVTGNTPVFQYFSQTTPGISLSQNLAFTTKSRIELPWAPEGDSGFKTQPLETTDFSAENLLQRASTIKQSSGPKWWKK